MNTKSSTLLQDRLQEEGTMESEFVCGTYMYRVHKFQMRRNSSLPSMHAIISHYKPKSYAFSC